MGVIVQQRSLDLIDGVVRRAAQIGWLLLPVAVGSDNQALITCGVEVIAGPPPDQED
jgi:hypothetical protein